MPNDIVTFCNTLVVFVDTFSLFLCIGRKQFIVLVDLQVVSIDWQFQLANLRQLVRQNTFE